MAGWLLPLIFDPMGAGQQVLCYGPVLFARGQVYIGGAIAGASFTGGAQRGVVFSGGLQAGQGYVGGAAAGGNYVGGGMAGEVVSQ